jgi:hypothetical protein
MQVGGEYGNVRDKWPGVRAHLLVRASCSARVHGTSAAVRLRPSRGGGRRIRVGLPRLPGLEGSPAGYADRLDVDGPCSGWHGGLVASDRALDGRFRQVAGRFWQVVGRNWQMFGRICRVATRTCDLAGCVRPLDGREKPFQERLSRA